VDFEMFESSILYINLISREMRFKATWLAPATKKISAEIDNLHKMALFWID